MPVACASSMERLVRAQIAFEETDRVWINMPLTDDGCLIRIILGETFYRAIVASSGPMGLLAGNWTALPLRG